MNTLVLYEDVVFSRREAAVNGRRAGGVPS